MDEQIDLAIQLDKPVIFHIRDAHGDMVDYFRGRKILPRGIIHCFSGSAETAKEYLRMGFYISFAGPLTFKKSVHLQDACRAVPLDRLLIETDSPYLAPVPFRGKRNSSLYLPYVVDAIAQIKGMDPEEVISRTEENAERLYRLRS